MVKQRKTLVIALVLALVGVLALGCGGSRGDGGESQPTAEEGTGSADFPAKDPGEPFALDEKGTVTITNDQAYEIQIQREGGDPLFRFSSKKGAVIDPSIDFTIRTFKADVPEELASQYVAVGVYAFEMHIAKETGYGFALRPKIEIFVTDQEIEDAKQGGASLDTLKGNLIVLYKEQRSPKWVPQTSLSWDEEAKTVTVSNVAGAGAWRLVAKKAQ